MTNDLILAAFIVLQILDAATTYAVIKRGGRELNPVLLWLQERLKPFTGARWAWLALAKLLALAAGAILHHNGQDYVLAGLCLAYVYVAVHNTRVLWGMKKDVDAAKTRE